MPTERILVGGGTDYDNTQVSAAYQPYYKFTTSDNFIWNEDGNRWNVGYNGPYNNTQYIDGTLKGINYVNNLFNGVVPYQNIFDSYYKNSINLFGPINSGNNQSLSVSSSKAYFSFGLPVVLTKYRMYNAFGEGVFGNSYGAVIGSDMGNQTPQDWNLAGTNDGVTWTTIDSRTNQAKFPNATSRLAKDCSYSEYAIASASAYKTYRLIVTKGGRSATECNKSGCKYDAFQIGEIQLLGYESPTTPCELHGGYTLFPTAKYLNGSGGLLTEPAGTDAKSSFARAFSNRGFARPLSSYYSVYSFYVIYLTSFWGSFSVAQNTIADTGYLDFGVAVTLSSYNMTSGSIKAWTLYGSNNNSTWSIIDDRSNVTGNNSSTIYNYTISSPGSYRYYKMEIKGGQIFSNKSGTYYTVQINALQFIGSVS